MHVCIGHDFDIRSHHRLPPPAANLNRIREGIGEAMTCVSGVEEGCMI